MTTIASPFFCRSVQQRVSQWTEFHQLYFFVYDPSNFVNSENVCFFRRKLLFRKNNNVWFVRPFFKCTFLFFSFFQMRWQIKILLFYVRWKMKNVSVCCACWAQKCAIETHWGRNGIWEGGKKSTHIIVEIHWKSVWKRVCCIFVQSAYTSIQCMLGCQLNKTNQMKWKEHGEKKEENEEREKRFPSQNQTDHHLWRLFVVGVEYQRERLVTTTARTHRPFLLLLKMCSFCVHSFHPFFVVFFLYCHIKTPKYLSSLCSQLRFIQIAASRNIYKNVWRTVENGFNRFIASFYCFPTRCFLISFISVLACISHYFC